MITLPPKEWFEQQTFWQVSLGYTGSTFVDWSINYLLDVKEHTVFSSDLAFNTAAVPQNPIMDTGTAHMHKKNHPKTVSEMLWQSHCFYKNNPNEFNTFYSTLPLWFLVPEDESHYKYQDVVANSIIDFFQTNPTVPHLIVDTEKWAPAFMCCRYMQTRYNNKDFNTLKLSEIKFPFSTDFDQPNYIVREQLALSNATWHNRFRRRCDIQNTISDALNTSLKISITDIFEKLDSVLIEISKKYKVINFNSSKFDVWKDIYQQWQASNPDVQWFKNLPTLINGIITKEDQVLTVNTPLEEMIVETELMLAGWSIKNYDLNKFPSDLRSLKLEPLIHLIGK